MLTLIVIAFAVARLTLIVTNDDVSQPFQTLAANRFPAFLQALVSCPDCLGVWFAAAATGVYAWNHEVAYWISLPFAISMIVSLLARTYR